MPSGSRKAVEPGYQDSIKLPASSALHKQVECRSSLFAATDPYIDVLFRHVKASGFRILSQRYKLCLRILPIVFGGDSCVKSDFGRTLGQAMDLAEAQRIWLSKEWIQCAGNFRYTGS